MADPLVRPRIVAWMRYFMQTTGGTPAELARALQTSRATVSNILNEKVEPGLDMLMRVHRNLHIPIERVINFFPEEFYSGSKKSQRAGP